MKQTTLTNLTPGVVYALGSGAGPVCNLGSDDLTGGRLTYVEDLNLMRLTKTGAFPVTLVGDGDPVLICSGVRVLPGLYTIAKRESDNSVLLQENPLSFCPVLGFLDILLSGFGTSGDTLNFFPTETISANPFTYRLQTIPTLANDIDLAGGATGTVQKIAKAMNGQPTAGGTDYFDGSDIMTYTWAGTAVAITGGARLPINAKVDWPGLTRLSQIFIVSSTITAGSMTLVEGGRVSPHYFNSSSAVADINFRVPTQPGNVRAGRGVKIYGFTAVFGTNPTITMANGSSMSNINGAAGAGTILPRSDYNAAFGYNKLISGVLPLNTYIQPWGPEGHTIGRGGMLFETGGTLPVIVVNHD